jgi:hypothetical protein
MISNENRQRALLAVTGMLTVLGVATYAGIVIQARFDLANSAVFPLAFETMPFGIAYALLRLRPRVGRVLTAVLAAGLVAVCGNFVAVNGMGGWWADVLTLAGGGTLALVGLLVALLPGESSRTADAVRSRL